MESGSDRMMQVDPHGWTLTLISVCVVFLALIILYFLYSLSGNIFSGKYKLMSKNRKAAPKNGDPGVAVAIALALEAELGRDDDVAAAVAMALHLSQNDGVHDMEPGIITIQRSASEWDCKARNFRKTPIK